MEISTEQAMQLLAHVQMLAKDAGNDPFCDDDFIADDYAGGNVDDAYSAGRSHMEASIGTGAKNLLATLGLGD